MLRSPSIVWLKRMGSVILSLRELFLFKSVIKFTYLWFWTIFLSHIEQLTHNVLSIVSKLCNWLKNIFVNIVLICLLHYYDLGQLYLVRRTHYISGVDQWLAVVVMGLHTLNEIRPMGCSMVCLLVLVITLLELLSVLMIPYNNVVYYIKVIIYQTSTHLECWTSWRTKDLWSAYYNVWVLLII